MKWIIGSLAIIALILGMSIYLVGLFALLLLLLSTWAVLAGAVLFGLWYVLYGLNFVKRRPALALVLCPLCAAFLAAVSVTGSIITASPPIMDRSLNPSVENELEYMFTTDQSDRYSGRFFVMPRRDRERLTRVRELDGEESHRWSSKSKYAAAMILQHGDLANDYKRAFELATMAENEGLVEAESLARAAFDRWQIAQGLPQRFGTQSKVTLGIGGWEERQE